MKKLRSLRPTFHTWRARWYDFGLGVSFDSIGYPSVIVNLIFFGFAFGVYFKDALDERLAWLEGEADVG